MAAPGRARLIDVATAAHVTKGIASRVLNRDPSLVVQQETRDRVLAAAEQLGYRPHPGARALATSRTMTLAFIAPALDNPPYVTISRGAYLRAEQLGYLSLLAEDLDDRPVGPAVIDGARVDGVLLGSAAPGHPLIDHLAETGLPHVFLNRSIAGTGRNVTMDVAAASRLAVERLHELGHRRIAHLAGPRQIEPSIARADAVRTSIEAAGLPALPVVHSGFSEGAAYEATRALLDARPTAIYTSSIGQAIGLLRALADEGVRVPQDVSVLTFDDFPVTDFTNPSLSAISMPLLELGAAGVDALVAQLDGHDPSDVVIPTIPRLVERGSTAPAPA